MKILITTNYDTDLNCYRPPVFIKGSIEDLKTETIRSLKKTEDTSILSQLAGCELYSLGTFDDETGVIEQDKILILKYNDYITVVKEAA